MLRKNIRLFYTVGLLLALAMLSVACGGVEGDSTSLESESVGNPARGEKLYNQTVIGAGSAPGCITCHSLEESLTLVGPSHFRLGTRAGEIVPGTSAETYLKESIVNPDSQITEGFTEGGMYKNYGKELSNQEIADLVAFLLTLK
jgi:mono/diheme cytochrome c family protein